MIFKVWSEDPEIIIQTHILIIDEAAAPSAEAAAAAAAASMFELPPLLLLLLLEKSALLAVGYKAQQFSLSFFFGHAAAATS